MKIKNNEWDFKIGAYSNVFIDKINGFAFKVFTKRKDTDELHSIKVFENEIKAFNLANKDEIFKSYIPNFYGKIKIQKIIDGKGNDISQDFYLDLNYKMEFIDGGFVKWNSIGPSNKKEITAHLNRLKISHYLDSSVIVDHEGNIQKIIDFSIKEIELFW